MSFAQGHNPSREISLYLYASFIARQLDEDGRPRCAYCGAELHPARRPGEAPYMELDHVHGDGYEADQCVVACPDCNGAAGRHQDRDYENLSAHLRGLGVDPRESAKRVNKILRMPLPERNIAMTVQIAEEFFGARLQYQREAAARRADRDPSTAGTGRTRAAQLAAMATGDDGPF